MAAPPVVGPAVDWRRNSSFGLWAATVQSAQSAVQSVQSAVQSEQSAVQSVQSAVQSVQSSVQSVQQETLEARTASGSPTVLFGGSEC